MKSLQLWNKLAEELARMCSTSALRDIKTVAERSKWEGESFLTITLPAFGKDFERSLDLGQVDRRLFTGFRWKGGLPRFLGGFLDRIFDRTSGRLLDDPCIDAIFAVRQLTLISGKVLKPCSDARRERAMREFVECEKEIAVTETSWSDAEMHDFRRVSSMLFGRMFTVVDREIYSGNVLPKHGPGNTADKLLGNEKYQQTTWTTRLEEVFHFGDFLFPSPSYWEQYDGVDLLEPGAEVPVKVTPVPKTQKTPRIIAQEPTVMQYVQQGLLSLINAGVREDKLLKDLICSDSQEPNQLLAQQGSLTGSLATLDLSEASDRVSYRLVQEMLRHHPHLRGAVDACRSRKADVPGIGIISLSKFASMGSALCFPFEAMVFLTCVFIGIERELKRPLCRRDIKNHVGMVRIYGDDIIIPVDMVQSVVQSLQLYGAKVNVAKSFWTGRFRESCGKEFYAGHDVSIVRIRKELPTRRTDGAELASLISRRNQFYKTGLWETARYIDDFVSRMIKHYPIVEESSPALGRYSFLGYQAERMCPTLHRPLVKAYTEKSKSPVNSLDGHGALLKYFLKRGEDPYEKDHLTRSGRAQSTYIKLGWFTPY